VSSPLFAFAFVRAQSDLDLNAQPKRCIVRWAQVSYVFQYEPYYIARSGMPPFNSAFKGRGGNKSQHVYALYAAGYRFIVMPQVRESTTCTWT